MPKRLVGVAAICLVALLGILFFIPRYSTVINPVRMDNKGAVASKEALVRSQLLERMVPPLPDPKDPAFHEQLRMDINKMKERKEILLDDNHMLMDFMNDHAYVLSVLIHKRIIINSDALPKKQDLTDLLGAVRDQPAEQIAEVKDVISKLLEDIDNYNMNLGALRKLDEGLASFEQASGLK